MTLDWASRGAMPRELHFSGDYISVIPHIKPFIKNIFRFCFPVFG